MISIQEALVKYNYAELTHEQLADHMGFTAYEKRILTMFWEPAFNSGWIYLSDEIILEQLTNQKGKDALKDFYNRVLITNDYQENIDYKKIDKNDNLIKLYQNIGSANLPNQKNIKKITTKKYYAITGDTYKDLLQKSANKKGKETRKYYRKVEQLAIFMKDYISALHKHILETKLAEKDTLIENKNKVIQENEAQINRIHELNKEYLSYKKLNEKNETIYIVSTYEYARQGIYKVGKTKKLMKTRTSGHNTTHVSGDKIKVLKEFKVNDATLIEKIIHKKLNGLLTKGDTEMFMCPYDLLENLINVIVNDDDNHNNLVNSIIDTVNTMRGLSCDSSQWMSGIDINIFNEEMQLVTPTNEGTEIQATFNITTATETQKKAFVTQCITAYKETIQDPQTVVWREFTKYLFQQLPIPKYQYKALQWKPIFNEVKDIEESV